MNRTIPPRLTRLQKGVPEIMRLPMAAEIFPPLTDDLVQSLTPSRTAASAPRSVASGGYEATPEEEMKFLRLVTACSRVTTHFELFLLVQGQLQFFLPQDVLITAWGAFRGQDPQIDVISNVPGLRTNRICDIIVPLMKRMHEAWIDGLARPILLDKIIDELQACPNGPCAVPCGFRGMRLTLVHGIQDKRGGFDSLYLALCRHRFPTKGDGARRRFLADLVIQQIDVAHRKVTALRTIRAQSNKSPHSLQLGVREREVTNWLCQGKTNAQIAQILGISTNTVKNHLHRIFEKLGADNRTEAAARYGDLGRAISADRSKES